MCFATLLCLRLLVVSPIMTGEGRIGQDFDPSFCGLTESLFQHSPTAIKEIRGKPVRVARAPAKVPTGYFPNKFLYQSA